MSSFLRSKLPLLVVKESARSAIYVTPDISFLKKGGGKERWLLRRSFNTSLSLHNHRGNQQPTEASVWMGMAKFANNLKYGNATNDVMNYLDRLLTIFAADWYRDNP